MGVNKDLGFLLKCLDFFADEVKKVHDVGVQLGIVIGGGNIYRGLSAGSNKVLIEQQGIKWECLQQ
jgi:uridylate kinase